jgi:hypothetical protein
MILKHDIGLIGDCVATFPIMIDIAKQQGSLGVVMPEGKAINELFDLLPKEHNLYRAQPDSDITLHLDLHEAFKYGDKYKLNMGQCYHHQVGLSTPKTCQKVTFNFNPVPWYVPFYVLAPFSRSLPEDQKWQREKWQQLVDKMDHVDFVLLGDSRYDDPKFVEGPHVYSVFDTSMHNVLGILSTSLGVISVVTGISHLAFHANVKNYLFVNQGAWGKNPDGIYMDKYIPSITVDEVINILKK